MLIVRDLGIEIGARRILNPVSFTVATPRSGHRRAKRRRQVDADVDPPRRAPEHLRIEGSVTTKDDEPPSQEPCRADSASSPLDSRTCCRREDSTTGRRHATRAPRTGGRSDGRDDRALHRARGDSANSAAMRRNLKSRVSRPDSVSKRTPLRGPRLALRWSAPPRRPDAGAL